MGIGLGQTIGDHTLGTQQHSQSLLENHLGVGWRLGGLSGIELYSLPKGSAEQLASPMSSSPLLVGCLWSVSTLYCPL